MGRLTRTRERFPDLPRRGVIGEVRATIEAHNIVFSLWNAALAERRYWPAEMLVVATQQEVDNRSGFDARNGQDAQAGGGD